MSSLKHALSKLKRNSVAPNSSASDAGSESDAKAAATTNGTASPRTSMSQDRGRSSVDGRQRQSINIIRSNQQRNSSAHHSPVRAIKQKLGFADSSSDDDDLLNRDGEKMSKNQARKAEHAAEKEHRRAALEKKEEEAAKQREEREKQLLLAEPPELKALYGDIPPNSYAGNHTHAELTKLTDLTKEHIGKNITFRARIHNMRVMSTKMSFFVFRQQTATLQGVLQEASDISAHFVWWAEHCDVEAVVLVSGVLQPPKSKQGTIVGASIHDCELLIKQMYAEAQVVEHLPFTVDEAEFTKTEAEVEGEKRVVIPDRVRMTNRVLDLRTTASQAIFRIQAGMCRFFRENLDNEGFVEIHTPKLQGGATESGASVFKLDYFGRPAFLAQSPQLAKQMCISADFGKVYEIGAVFRAENSNTHRHLTEYTGLDLEMTIDEHYHEVLRTLDRTFKHIFSGIYKNYRHEIDTVKRQFPHEDLVWLEETPIIPFAEGIRMLNESGYRNEEGKELPEDEDMGTRDEIALGKVIKEKYKTDFYVLDKFPVTARPFYAMPDPQNPAVTNSFDIFLRGQEILSGGQRIHDAAMLLKNLDKWKIKRSSMEEYIQGFEWGAPPHGGGGIGMERMLMLLLNLGDIRHGCLFPRDPKSLPEQKPIKELRHPEASTMHPPWEGKDRMTAGMDFQPIEKLIANYGDATNTSWLEPRIQVWRDQYTGAGIGWCPIDKNYAILVGNPLCHESQYTKTIAAFLRYIQKEERKKPLWVLVGGGVEEALAENFNWRTFSVAAEQRLNPGDNPAMKDSDVTRKVRHAEKEGVKLHDIPQGTKVPDEIVKKVDERVKDWMAGRKGKQVHLTDIHLWQDMEHRSYHYALDKSGTVAAIVVLAQLSPDNGWQIKWALDFPNSPGGTIEYTVTHTLKYLQGIGCSNCTFGGGASANFTPGHNLRGTKVKMLSKAYHTIVTELKLTNKTEFREKLGAKDDPIYVCYPPHGLGPMGVRAILNFFEEEPQGQN